MASGGSGRGDADFSCTTSTDEAPMPFYSWPDKQRQRVCILGGGFGGLHTALTLDSLLWPCGEKPQVVLIDKSDRFVFKPMLYELLSGEVDVWEIAPSLSGLLKNTCVQFVRDNVKLLRPSDHVRRENGWPCTGGVVYLESGTVIEYDWLVIALGAEAKNDVIPGSAEYALPFMTLEDALRVESKLQILENSRFGKDAPTIQVAVVGLGYNGTALAVTISERLKNTGTVKAINAQATICPVAPPGIRGASWRVIKSRNVDLLFGYHVSSIRESRRPAENPNIAATNSQTVNDRHNKKLILDLNPVQSGLKGETLEADLVLWTVGYASPIPRLLPHDASSHGMSLTDRGHVETEETLQVRGHPRTFAIGDSAAVRDPSGQLLPDSAQAAFEQAHHVACNIWAAINGRPLSPFRFQKFGEFMSLGRNEAAISVDFVEVLTLEGPAAHAARKLAYCVRMPTQEHRVKVGISWFTRTLMDSVASEKSSK